MSSNPVVCPPGKGHRAEFPYRIGTNPSLLVLVPVRFIEIQACPVPPPRSCFPRRSPRHESCASEMPCAPTRFTPLSARSPMAGGFYEDLPDQCPPSDASSPTDGQEFYRLVSSNSPVPSDFDSHTKKGLAGKFSGVDPCELCSCSLWESIERARGVRRRKASGIVKIVLDSTAGKIKPTRSPGHFSWWISADFDPCQHSHIVPPET
jgi:hypothetical protein